MKVYRVEKKDNEEWSAVGTYNAKFISQMAQAVGLLYKKGYTIYDTLRIVEVKKNGKHRIL